MRKIDVLRKNATSIINAYLTESNTIDLGEKYNCSSGLIFYLLKENGVKTRSRSEILKPYRFKKGHVSWLKGKKGLTTAWNRGKTRKDDKRIAQPWLGKKRSKETIEKIRLKHTKVNKKEFLRLFYVEQLRTEEIAKRLNVAKSTLDTWRMRNGFPKRGWANGIHPNWMGGKSFEPYGVEFNKELKEKVRRRDGYRCQECGKLQKELNCKLDIHHIDYNKKNNSLENLISLCKSCHSKTNFSRKDWIKYFKRKRKKITYGLYNQAL